MCSGCEHDLFFLNPNCVGLSLCSSAIASLVCNILASILYAVLSKLMDLYISGSVLLPLPLYISTAFAKCHSVGSRLFCMIELSSCWSSGLLLSSSHLYASVGILSGPGALLFLQC